MGLEDRNQDSATSAAASGGLLSRLALVLSALIWLAVLALAIDTVVDFSILYGIPGLLGLTVGAALFRLARRSWALALLGSSIASLVVMLAILFATFRIY